ncbi:hypothetical protein VTK73DRAFT_1309 [Phialemonium thermophilum]|uniref:Uncharacterized protein n=1 Tax=Phialemonium thermophilum TaxID=223376 RepID=A0ABR3VTN5_9PEZI
MWNRLRSLQEGPKAPLPPPVTVRCIRFPADGSTPHLLSLTTTTHGVADGPDSPWGHIPDLRPFWGTPRAWEWRHFETFRLADQTLEDCDGLYVLFFSFDVPSLPENRNFPASISVEQRTFAGDAFVARLRGTEIGEDLGQDGWAAWIDVSLDILKLPIMRT